LPPSSVGWPPCGLCLLLCCVVTRPATPPPSRPGLPPTGSAATPPPNATIRFFHDVRRPRHTLLRLPHTTGLPPPRQGRPQALRSLVKVLPINVVDGHRFALHRCRAEIAYPASGVARSSYVRRLATCDLLISISLVAIWIRSDRQEQSVPCSQCFVKDPTSRMFEPGD
jgi:hypothetical protein